MFLLFAYGAHQVCFSLIGAAFGLSIIDRIAALSVFVFILVHGKNAVFGTPSAYWPMGGVFFLFIAEQAHQFYHRQSIHNWTLTPIGDFYWLDFNTTLKFQASQWLYVNCNDLLGGLFAWHPFTIACAPERVQNLQADAPVQYKVKLLVERRAGWTEELQKQYNTNQARSAPQLSLTIDGPFQTFYLIIPHNFKYITETFSEATTTPYIIFAVPMK